MKVLIVISADVTNFKRFLPNSVLIIKLNVVAERSRAHDSRQGPNFIELLKHTN